MLRSATRAEPLRESLAGRSHLGVSGRAVRLGIIRLTWVRKDLVGSQNKCVRFFLTNQEKFYE